MNTEKVIDKKEIKNDKPILLQNSNYCTCYIITKGGYIDEV